MLNIEKLISSTQNLSWEDKIKFVSSNVEDAVFSTSFSIEDQIILDVIFKNDLNIDVFALDTGRLPAATYELWQKTLDKYKKKIKVYCPSNEDIEDFVEINGINSFYESVKFRHQCCHIRKVEPLKRAIKNKKLWISGVRKEHTLNRKNKDFFEFDEIFNIAKFYPVLELSEGEIWEYIKKNNIPYNKLYDEGYKSIGCDPCTRAVEEGEDPRAGRWWWETKSEQECGLHVVDGKLERVKKDNNKDVF